MHEPKGAQRPRAGAGMSGKALVPVSRYTFSDAAVFISPHLDLIMGCNICCQTREVVL